MINDKIQKQQAGDSSTNLQGQSIIINNGITYSDAKEIALDVYKANFIQLSRDAGDLARARAEELTDAFLERLKTENQDAVSELRQPGMQAALFEAQKQYAKTGDKDLEGLLIDILVERASTPERNIHQIVLDESLFVAAKLTTEQMDALTINFLISKTSNNTLVNLDALDQYIETEITPFLSELTDKSSCYEHLEYVGCGSIMHMGGMYAAEQILREQYSGLFSKGFDGQHFEEVIGTTPTYQRLLMPCLHDVEKLQINALNDNIMKEILKEIGASDETVSKFQNLLNSALMNDQEVKDLITNRKPESKKLFDI